MYGAVDVTGGLQSWRSPASLAEDILRCPSDYEQIDELVDRRRFQAALVLAQLENRLAPFLRKAAAEVGAELRFQQRDAVLAPAAVPDRIFADNFLELLPVLERDGERVGDGALCRVVVVAGELLVLDADHFRAQRVDAFVRGHIVFVVDGGEPAVD